VYKNLKKKFPANNAGTAIRYEASERHNEEIAAPFSVLGSRLIRNRQFRREEVNWVFKYAATLVTSLFNPKHYRRGACTWQTTCFFLYLTYFGSGSRNFLRSRVSRQGVRFFSHMVIAVVSELQGCVNFA
jgi:hypothetical protein